MGKSLGETRLPVKSKAVLNKFSDFFFFLINGGCQVLTITIHNLKEYKKSPALGSPTASRYHLAQLLKPKGQRSIKGAIKLHLFPLSPFLQSPSRLQLGRHANPVNIILATAPHSPPTPPPQPCK